jgi:RimJ/RimL family protein N-acetyltransferase
MPGLGPVDLRGRHVRLEPLQQTHAAALLEVAQDPQIWTWMSARPTTPASMEAWISTALEAQERGEENPFAVIEADGRVIGSTRYMDVQEAHCGVEIGWTWYAPDTWGTVINPECKFLMFQHAFETWGAIRVALKTDALNLRSQAAIKKLGAKFEGILRNHRIRLDSSLRDTVMFSVIASEWPGVKATLETRIASFSQGD